MSKNPRTFEVGSTVEHNVHGRCTVQYYYRGQHMPYDLKSEDTGHCFPSFRKDMKLAGPRPPEIYEEWFR